VREDDSYDLLEERVERPVDRGPDPVAARLVARTRAAVEGHEVTERVIREADRRFPDDPTPRDASRLAFSGFQAAYAVAVGLFTLLMVVGDGSVLFWLSLTLLLVVMYGAVLPLMAADVYLLRRLPDAAWRPPWWSLAGFLVGPLALASCGVYWAGRRLASPA
jgi:hypothetical protein